MINSLSRLPNLRVISRSSAFRYKGKDTDPRAAARELGVHAVLTGRVVQRGDSLSVSAEARKLLYELKEHSKRSYVSWCDLAAIHVGLGERDQALACLERAYEQRDTKLVLVTVEPTLDPLRSDPRFQDLLRRVGLPP